MFMKWKIWILKSKSLSFTSHASFSWCFGEMGTPILQNLNKILKFEEKIKVEDKRKWHQQDGGLRAFYYHPATEHRFWQPPIDKSTFVGVQEYEGDQHSWGWKSSNWGSELIKGL